MNKIRFAVVGIGRMGRGQIREILKNVPNRYELAAVCDVCADRMEGLPAEWGKEYRKYTSLDELLADGSVDLVSLATRHLDHVPMALRVLEAGKACMVEKPAAPNVVEMEKLRQSELKHPGKLFIRHNRRFEPAFVKAMELIGRGVLGEVQYIRLCRAVGYCRRNDWMTSPDEFGGLFTNWGPHLIDQALRLLGSPVTEVWADLRRVISIGAGDDMSRVMLRGANGRLAEIELSGVCTAQGRELEIIGSRGTLYYEGGAKTIHVRMVDPAIEFRDLAPHRDNPPLQYGNFEETLSFVDADYELPGTALSDVWKHCAAALLDNVPYPITTAEAMEVVRITEEAIRKSGFAPLRKFCAQK
jgi:predicted dehydrogenase